jgi:hypothetical protein
MVIRTPTIKAFIPAPRGALLSFPKAMVIPTRMALPMNSVKNTFTTRKLCKKRAFWWEHLPHFIYYIIGQGSMATGIHQYDCATRID